MPAETADAPSARRTYPARAKLNALQRWRDRDDPAVTTARGELNAAMLEDHIRRVVDSAPPLTPEQLERLRSLLPAPTDTDGGDGL